MIRNHALIASLLPVSAYYKGGGSPPPAPTDYAAQSRAAIEQQNNSARIAQEQAARDKAEKDAQHAQDVDASRGRIATAYEGAKSYGNTQLGLKGLDSSSGYGADIASLYGSALDRARGSAPEVVTDAGALFGPSVYDEAYGTVRGKARRDYRNEADQFIGDGFDYNTWSDNADDNILSSILGDQKTEAQSTLDRSLARGTVNDVGYATGKKAIGQQYSSGLAKANQTGLGVLSGYRKDLNDFAGNVNKKIDNYDFGDSLNLGNYRSQLDTKVGGQRNSLEGDILAAIGGTNYFDTDSILGKAGNASGITNNTVPSGTAGGPASGLNSTAGYLTQATDTSDKKTTGTSF